MMLDFIYMFMHNFKSINLIFLNNDTNGLPFTHKLVVLKAFGYLLYTIS